MRKWIIPAVGVVIVTATLGYGALWYTGSQKVQATAQQWVDHFNKEAEGKAKLTHEGLHVGGFPLRYDVEMKKPVVQVNYTALLREVNGSRIPLYARPTLDTIAWNDTIHLGDALKIGHGLNDQTYTAQVIGDVTVDSSVGDRKYAMRLSADTQTPITVVLDGVPPNEKEAVKHFMAGRFRATNLKATLEGATEPLTTTDEINIDITRTPRGAQESLSVKLGVVNSMIQPSLVSMLQSHPYLKAMADAGLYSTAQMPTGRSDVGVDLTVQYPVMESSDTQQPFSLNIANFQLKTPLYYASVKGTVNTRTAKLGAPQSFIADLTAEQRFEPAFQYAWVEQSLVQYNNFAPLLGGEGAAAQAPTPEQLTQRRALLNAALPNLTDLGTVRTNFQCAFDAENPTAATLTITNVGMVTDRFGMTFDGQGQGMGAQATGHVRLTLAKYVTLVDDLTGYLNRAANAIAPAVAPMASQQPQLTPLLAYRISPEFVTSIKQFLRAIADNPNGTEQDLTITLKRAPNEPMPTVGTLALPDIMARYEQLIAPHLPKAGDAPAEMQQHSEEPEETPSGEVSGEETPKQ